MSPHREALRTFIAAAHDGRVAPADIADDTPLLERRLLTSLMVAELLLFLEERRGAPVDPRALGPGCFRDVATIAGLFLETGGPS